MLEDVEKYVSLSDLKNMKINIDKEKEEIKRYKELISEIDEKINVRLDAINEGENIEEVLRQEIDYYKEVAGLTKVRGPGVVVLINDAERELIQNENPNNLIVHDADIQMIVEDLFNAGAEAISVNGQRVIYNYTKIVCNGPTIRINDEVFAQPFIVKAIGNRDYLNGAINAPGSYGNMLRQWGIFVEVNTSISMTIPEFKSPIYNRYSKVLEE
jgi:uncharacterized protein YlxW (UPF0749 family)